MRVTNRVEGKVYKKTETASTVPAHSNELIHSFSQKKL